MWGIRHEFPFDFQAVKATFIRGKPAVLHGFCYLAIEELTAGCVCVLGQLDYISETRNFMSTVFYSEKKSLILLDLK